MKIKDYILEIPSKMQDILTYSDRLFEEVKKYEFKKMIITGSGTSYHSAVQVKEQLRALIKSDIEVLYPFQINDEIFENYEDNILFIGISQSGASLSTLNAMKIAKNNNNVKVASMAGVENALIDEVSDYVLTVHCGDEKAGPKTKGYTTTKLNLLLLGIKVSEFRESQDKLQEITKQIDESMETYQKVVELSEKWVENHKNDLAESDNIIVIGSADLYGDTLEGALKLLETLRIPCSGYVLEEFIHGIYNSINEKSTIIFFDDGKEAQFDNLINVLREWTNRIYIISNQEGRSGDKTIILPLNDNSVDRMFFITPIHFICSEVPGLKGIDPVIPKDRNFHQKMNSKVLN